MSKYESALFPNRQNLFARYNELSEQDPFTKLRERFLRNYNRRDWSVMKGNIECRKEPNFGQFRFKLDAVIGSLVMILTERKDWIKVEPKYPEPGIPYKPFSTRVSASFHKYFIRRWEGRFLMEVYAAFDIAMYGKAIEFWPSPGCVYTENIPVENVFPDSRAGLDTKKWSYVFIKKEYTIAELRKIYETNTNTILEDFNKKYLKKMIDWVDQYGAIPDGTERQKGISGEQDSSVQDLAIPIVYAFVKDNFNSEKKVSVYAFHADLAEYQDGNVTNRAEAERSMPQTRILMSKNEYCECISQVLAVRAMQITRSYWKFNSIAQQIYLATQLYDQSINLMLRLAKRHSILYLQSDSPGTQQKLLKQNDAEVQVVDSDVKFVQMGNQNSNVREIMEITRQVMIDTENGQAITQAPGSQNTKGYAITAEEARIRSQQEGESQILSFKILMNQDIALYGEIYRRAMQNDDTDHTKGYKKFKEEMELYSVESEYYEYEDVYFVPSFNNGGTQFARLTSANAIGEILQRQPMNMGQERAQMESIAALVGVDNVGEYIQDKNSVNPVIIKAGRENEDLDNSFANPMNIPVLPDDKHLEEIPIHIADYENKLNKANQVIQIAGQYENRFRQLIALTLASDMIAAQDLKGAHISAHIQAASNSKENIKAIQPQLEKFAQLQASQDKLIKQVTQLTEQLDKLMAESTVQNAELDFNQKKYAMELDFLAKSNEIALGKAVSQSEMATDRTQKKYAEQENKAILDTAVKKTKAEIDLTNKQQQHEQSIEAERIKAQTKQAGTSKKPTS